MTAQIVLVRHAETVANATEVWQGMSDAELTPKGKRQVEELMTRLAPEDFDRVISSDLGRAVSTAAAVSGPAPEMDAAWREMNVGSWEGRSNSDLERDHGEELAALRRGEDLPIGGGERFSEFAERVWEAYEALAGGLDEGARALVVTHGGVIFTLVSRILGVDLRNRALRVGNTALTSILLSRYGPQISIYNDASHLDDARLRVRGPATDLLLLRHGETTANVENRWQGHSHGELTDEGRLQAERLADALPQVDALYTSPLTRAADTAAAVARRHGLEPLVREELKEIGFGAWELLTPDEIHSRDAETLTRLWGGEDLARGGTGETYRQVRERMSRTIEEIAESHAGRRVAVVSHGGAVRAFVTEFLGMGFPERHRLGILRNTAMARVVRGDDGFALGAWNLAPHLV